MRYFSFSSILISPKQSAGLSPYFTIPSFPSSTHLTSHFSLHSQQHMYSFPNVHFSVHLYIVLLLSACPIQEPLSGSALRHLCVSGDSARNPTCVKVNFIYFPLAFPVITIRRDMNNRVSMPIAFHYIGFHFIAPFCCTLCGLSVVRFLCEQLVYGAA